MTGYSGLILFIISFYATINFYRLFAVSRRIFHFCIASASVFIAIIAISDYLVYFFPVLNAGLIYDWSMVFAVSLGLSAAAALIRDFKPELTQFPKQLTFLPLVLIVFYPFIIDSTIIKMWVITLYQLSTIIIGLLIYSYKTSVDSTFGYKLVGIIFFLITFILYRLPGYLFSLPEYGWMLLTASGILIITVGYNQVFFLEKHTNSADSDGNIWFK